MNHSATVMLRWSWLLGVSLFGPVALPAGGAERRLPQVRRQQQPLKTAPGPPNEHADPPPPQAEADGGGP